MPDQGVIKPIIQRDLDGAWAACHKLIGVSAGKSPPRYQDYPPKMRIKTSSAKAKNEFIIAMGISAQELQRIWPLDYFIKLCHLLVGKNPHYRILLFLGNAPHEMIMRKKLENSSLPPQVEIPSVPMRKLPALVDQASLYMGNNSGIKHLAAALNIKTCTFFSKESGHLKEWHPYDPIQHSVFHYDKTIKGNLFTGNFDPSQGEFLKALTPEQLYSDLLPWM